MDGVSVLLFWEKAFNGAGTKYGVAADMVDPLSSAKRQVSLSLHTYNLRSEHVLTHTLLEGGKR